MNDLRRFEKFVSPEPNSGCWLWEGATGDGRYGAFRFEGRAQLAHRASYVLHKGPIPDGRVVRHKCDNTFCVNPDHLIAGSQGDNLRDAVDRRRSVHHRHPEVARANGLRLVAFHKANPIKGEAHHNAKLTAAQVAAIRISRDRYVDLAALFGVSKSLIAKIRQGKLWQ